MDSTTISIMLDAIYAFALVCAIFCVVYLIVDSITFRRKNKPPRTEPGVFIRIPERKD